MVNNTSTALIKTDNNNKRITGRPTKLTPVLQDKICEYIAAGNYLITACNAVGISDQTMLNWLERGRQEADNGGGIYFGFLGAVKKAESAAEQLMVERLRDAAMPGLRKTVTKTDGEGNTSVEQVETGGEWLAAATFLERRHPDRWGRKDRTQVSIEETRTINITQVTVVKDYGEGKIEEGKLKEIKDETPY